MGQENVFYDILERKNAFQSYKKENFNQRKIDIFPKGLTHVFGEFSTLFFQAILARKTSSTIFQNEKTPLQAIKTRSSKGRKIDIFPKGLTQGFGVKMVVFPTFIFQAIQARKMFFTIFQNEKTPFQAIKTRSSKSRKIVIFLKGLTDGFGPKMALLLPFFKAIQARKMSFTILQNQKTPPWQIKTKSSKTRKINIFSKGLTHGFGLKMAVFPAFNFQAIQARKNFFCDILEQKTPQYTIKTRSSKSRKIEIFSKGVNPWF